MYGCYKHATSIKAALIDEGYTDAVLSSVNAPTLAPKPAPAQRVLNLNHDPSIPPCFVDSDPPTHKRGVLQIQATPHAPTPTLTPTPEVFRVCVDCLSDFLDTLRGMHYTDLHITAPEYPAFTAWRS